MSFEFIIVNLYMTIDTMASHGEVLVGGKGRYYLMLER